MTVWVAILERQFDDSCVLGVFMSRWAAWRACVRDWRVWDQDGYQRYGLDRPDRTEGDWAVDYRVEDYEVAP